MVSSRLAAPPCEATMRTRNDNSTTGLLCGHHINFPQEGTGSLPRLPSNASSLLLQGGGALGDYQVGVYEALSEAHLAALLGRRYFIAR